MALLFIDIAAAVADDCLKSKPFSKTPALLVVVAILVPPLALSAEVIPPAGGCGCLDVLDDVVPEMEVVAAVAKDAAVARDAVVDNVDVAVDVVEDDGAVDEFEFVALQLPGPDPTVMHIGLGRKSLCIQIM